jgi:hypothetical protein
MGDKKLPTITFCSTDDWTACYLDGVLIDEGHSFHAPYLLEELSSHLGIKVNDVLWYTEEQMDEMGNHFPEKLEDIHG